MSERLLSTQEVGYQLGITPGTLRTWCAENPPRITFVRVGGRYKFRQSDVNTFMTSKTVAAVSPGRTARSQRAHAKN